MASIIPGPLVKCSIPLAQFHPLTFLEGVSLQVDVYVGAADPSIAVIAFSL